jgi:hypothetical protein
MHGVFMVSDELSKFSVWLYITLKGYLEDLSKWDVEFLWLQMSFPNFQSNVDHAWNQLSSFSTINLKLVCCLITIDISLKCRIVNFLATSNATVALFSQSSNYFLVLQFPEDAVSIDEEFSISSHIAQTIVIYRKNLRWFCNWFTEICAGCSSIWPTEASLGTCHTGVQAECCEFRVHVSCPTGEALATRGKLCALCSDYSPEGSSGEAAK